MNVSSIKPYRLKAILFSLLSCTLLISCTALASSDRASTTQTVLGEWSTVGGPAFGCNGQINAIRRATTGQIYIGGQFSVCGGEEVHNIALYDPVANEFHALVHDGVNGVGGNVSSIFIDANQVYVGGSFQTAGPTNSNNIARWDGAQWHSLGTGANNGVDALVLTMEVFNNDLFIGGYFRNAEEQSANRIARWDGTQFHSVGSGVPNGTDSVVRALEVVSEGLVVGGDFSQAGEVSARRIALWDGSTWQTFGNDAIGSASSSSIDVHALLESNGFLYVGGEFGEAGGVSTGRVARWDGQEWQALGNVPNALASAFVVRSLAAAGSSIFVAGAFQSLTGDEIDIQNVARWDGAEWHTLSDGQDAGVDWSAQVLEVSDGSLYVGGDFFRAGHNLVNGIARWDGFEWLQIGSPGHGLSDGVWSFAPSSNGVFAAGNFEAAGERKVNYIAHWTGSEWEILDDSGNAGLGNSVYALEDSVDGLYVGGLFYRSSPTDTTQPLLHQIARWAGSDWHVLGGDSVGIDPDNLSDYVVSLEIYGDDLFVGGSFDEAGGLVANNLAKWDGIEWNSIGDGIENGVNGAVWDFAFYQGDLYVGGSFTHAGTAIASNLARWDGNSWHSVGSEGNEGLNDGVRSLAVWDNQLYVGGFFTQAGGSDANHVARWDGTEWKPLDDGGINGVNSLVRAMTTCGAGICVGGEFTTAGQTNASHVARWNGTTWQLLNGGTANGVNGQVRALEMYRNTLFVGGDFSSAGGKVSSHMAMFELDRVFQDRFESN